MYNHSGLLFTFLYRCTGNPAQYPHFPIQLYIYSGGNVHIKEILYGHFSAILNRDRTYPHLGSQTGLKSPLRGLKRHIREIWASEGRSRDRRPASCPCLPSHHRHGAGSRCKGRTRPVWEWTDFSPSTVPSSHTKAPEKDPTFSHSYRDMSGRASPSPGPSNLPPPTGWRGLGRIFP